MRPLFYHNRCVFFCVLKDKPTFLSEPIRRGINFTTKSIWRTIYSCDGLCRKTKFYYIFDQWIFGILHENIISNQSDEIVRLTGDVWAMYGRCMGNWYWEGFQNCTYPKYTSPKYTSPKYYRNSYFIDLIFRQGHMQNFDLWIKSKTSFICLTLLSPPISEVDQKSYPGVYVNANCLYSLLLSVTQTLWKLLILNN